MRPRAMRQFSVSLFAVAEVIRVLALLISSRRLRAFAFLPILTIYLYLVVFTTTGTPTLDMNITSLIMPMMSTASDFLVVTDAHRDLQQIGAVGFAHLKSWASKLIWAVDLSYNPRGVGWNFEPRSVIPPHPTLKRWRFVVQQLRRALMAYIVMDTATTLFRAIPAFRLGGSMTRDGFLWRVFYVLTWFSAGVSGMALPHTILAIIFVGLGLTAPSYWPNLFGNWVDAYTVRKFWGRSYHQSLRRPLTSHAKYMTSEMLHLTPGSFVFRRVELHLAFFISGFMHFVDAYAMLRHAVPASGALYFFSLQAVAITLEDGVIALGKRIGVQDGALCGMIGYTWVCAWLALSAPIWLDPLVHAGMTAELPGAPFSVISYIEKIGRSYLASTIPSSGL